MHPPPAWGRGGLKISEKILLGAGSEILILVVVVEEGGHIILKQKLKLHNTNIKSIFGINNLIYFRGIWKIHLLTVKLKQPFLKQLASHVSAAMLQLKFPCMKFFLIHPRHWNIFFGRLKSVLCSVNERQVITHKKKQLKIMMILTFFFNKLFLLLYKSIMTASDQL